MTINYKNLWSKIIKHFTYIHYKILGSKHFCNEANMNKDIFIYVFCGFSTVRNPLGCLGLMPGSGRFPRVRKGNKFQYSCLENSMEKRSQWVTSQWRFKESDMTEHARFGYMYLKQNFIHTVSWLVSNKLRNVRIVVS